MIEAPHYTSAGARRDASFALPADYFDGMVHEAALHQSVRAYLNNQRQGTAATKTRGFVSGGNQKPWRQKGTGRARQGSIRAPHWRGGGTVFGPQPRDYQTDMPRKVRQLARRSALNARAREGALHVIERLAFRAPKTSQLAGLLRSFGLADRKVLILTAGTNSAVYLSGRNLPTVHVMPYQEASAYEILWSDAVVVEEGALTGVTPVEEEEKAESAETAEGTAKTGKTGKTGRTEKTGRPATSGKKAAKAPKPRAEAKTAKKSTTKRATKKAGGKAAQKPAARRKPASKPKKKGSE